MGDRGLNSLRHARQLQGHHDASRTGSHAGIGPSPGYRVALATELLCGSDLSYDKKGHDRTLTALVGLKGKTPLVPRIKSSIPPWKVQAKAAAIFVEA